MGVTFLSFKRILFLKFTLNSYWNLCLIFYSTSYVASSSRWFLQRNITNAICLFLSYLTCLSKTKQEVLHKLNCSQAPHHQLSTHELGHWYTYEATTHRTRYESNLYSLATQVSKQPCVRSPKSQRVPKTSKSIFLLIWILNKIVGDYSYKDHVTHIEL